MKRRILENTVMIVGILVLISGVVLAPNISSSQTSKIVIGVPVPTTGFLGEVGQAVAAGCEFAVFEANEKGGILGRKIEMRVEDTKAEPNTAAAVAEKLLTKDKVFALVGGLGSVPDFSMLQSIKGYNPLIIHCSSSALKVEETFGQMPGYFHVFIWDYQRQMTAVKFLGSLSPKPKTIGMLYEDGIYGTLAYDYAKQFFKESGFDLILGESFKSRSPDFSAILGKVKVKDPEILYVAGFAMDYVQLARQSKTLEVNPKLKLLVDSGNVRKDFGEEGDGLAFVQLWSPKTNIPGMKEWVARFDKFKPGYGPRSGVGLGYGSMDILLKAIERAGALDKEKVIAALERGKFWTPFGEGLSFKPSQKAKHQLMNEDTQVIIQYHGNEEEVVFPFKAASAKLRYPVSR